MSPSQWLVIALNLCAFIAMVTAFAVAGWRETERAVTAEEDLPPLTPGWEYREGLKTL